MTLCLHAGAKAVTYDELRQIQTPEPTDTHVPIPHHELVELVRYTLGFHQHEIVEEHFGAMPDGSRFFGVMTLRSPYGNYGDIVGLRNSHDKSFPIGVCFGSRTFVCDNTAFISDHVVKRKHTNRARRELPYLLQEIVAPLQQQRISQNRKLVAYQRSQVSDAHADHLIMEMYRREVIGVTQIARVLEAYERPPHDWGSKTLWRVFNSATYVVAGKVSESPDITRRLHEIIDCAIGDQELVKDEDIGF